MAMISWHTKKQATVSLAPILVETDRTCNAERCNDTMKALRHPGGTLVGEMVSAMASHDFRVGVMVLNIWERTHQFSKKVTDIVIDSDLFEQADRQASLKANHVNKLYLDLFVPNKESDVKNDFVTKLDEFISLLDSIRGCTNIPVTYVLRKCLIPKAEVHDDEDDYATIDRHMIQRVQIIKTAHIGLDVEEL